MIFVKVFIFVTFCSVIGEIREINANDSEEDHQPIVEEKFTSTKRPINNFGTFKRFKIENSTPEFMNGSEKILSTTMTYKDNSSYMIEGKEINTTEKNDLSNNDTLKLRIFKTKLSDYDTNRFRDLEFLKNISPINLNTSSEKIENPTLLTSTTLKHESSSITSVIKLNEIEVTTILPPKDKSSSKTEDKEINTTEKNTAMLFTFKYIPESTDNSSTTSSENVTKGSKDFQLFKTIPKSDDHQEASLSKKNSSERVENAISLTSIFIFIIHLLKNNF